MRSNVSHVCFVIMIIAVLAVSFGHETRTGFENVQLTFVDVGQGDCMHVHTDKGYEYLIDGGGSENYSVGKSTLRPYLLKNGVSHLDGVFVTHLHTDHYRGIVELCRYHMVDDLYIYDGNRVELPQIMADTGLSKEQIHFLWQGMRLELDENAAVSVLWPRKQTETQYRTITSDPDRENEISLIMKLSIDGVSALATGDVDEECEKSLISTAGNDLQSDILKVAHHGSKYSSSDMFLAQVSPKLAVIQVGKNTYGHPTPEAISRLNAAGSKVYRTDRNGAVGIKIDEGKIQRVVTVIKSLN